MVFSEINWNDAEEMKSIIPVSAALSYTKVGPSLNAAYDMFIRTLLGDNIVTIIDDIYSNTPSSDIQKKILSVCQKAVANLAFWYNFDELNLRITDQGFQREESDTKKPLYKYQEDNLRSAFKNKGFNALDELVGLFYSAIDVFPDFKNSPAYVQRKIAIIKSTEELNRIYFINSSYLIFLRLDPIFRILEDTDLKAVVGSTLFDLLKNNLEKEVAVIGNTTTEELRLMCMPYLAMQAVAYLIRTTGSITDRGLYFSQIMAGDGNEQKNPVDLERVNMMLEDIRRSADSYREQLLNFIELNIADKFGGRPSDALKRDNTDKTTFWA